MSGFENRPKKRPLVIGVAGLALLVGAYLFSTGPICRWRPGSAERIFAPLNPLTEMRLTRPLVRGWLTLWGVDPDKRHLITLKGAPGEFVGARGASSQIIGMQMADGTVIPYTNGAEIPIYRKKAESGDAGAQESLAISLFEDTQGFGTNRVEAYKWAATAASQGRKSAKDLVREFEMFMTPEEVSRGKAAVRSSLGTTNGTTE